MPAGVIPIPVPGEEDYPPLNTWPRFALDQRVVVRPNHVNAGRTGKVIGWGRAASAHEHWTIHHEPVLKCTYGTSCDCLVDNEGPLVLWDGSTEDIDWFPGQGMSALEEVTDVP